MRAEAQRQIRSTNIATDKVDQLVDLLVAEALNTRSIPLTRTDDAIVEPLPLRRTEGSSIYTVAGADLFTSTRILQAERRLITTAGRTDGRTVVRLGGSVERYIDALHVAAEERSSVRVQHWHWRPRRTDCCPG
jgi:hypothetical protein